MNSFQSTLSKDIAAKESHISALEQSVRSLSSEKSELFDQLQLRQAELESSQLQMDSLQSQNNELQYQLRECNDRIALLAEELSDARQGLHDSTSPDAHDSTVGLDSMLSAVEAKYEIRLSDLQKRFDAAEKERSEAEVEWSRKLSDKAKELDGLKKALSSVDKHKGIENEKLSGLMHENEKLLATLKEQKTRILTLERQTESFVEVEVCLHLISCLNVYLTVLQDAAKMQVLQAQSKLTALEQQITELKTRETQLKANNKVTIHDNIIQAITDLILDSARGTQKSAIIRCPARTSTQPRRWLLVNAPRKWVSGTLTDLDIVGYFRPTVASRLSSPAIPNEQE
jgi:hypothetical protein